ncbi:hypothetical protein [uncultured Microscilla sp.]|uniref:hypothetical protein n=1 Tax=uncultured Microscilla sp. TaxID=432653 RepID=UPI002632332E|nr:hypothetical protein [uncultured Microscilla sp.]
MKKTKRKQSLDSARLTPAEMAKIYGGCCGGTPVSPSPPPAMAQRAAMFVFITKRS